MHTATQMGSGHFPKEGFGQAAFFRRCFHYYPELVPWTPPRFDIKVSRPGCYALGGLILRFREKTGTDFYYGGPGGPHCDQ